MGYVIVLALHPLFLRNFLEIRFVAYRLKTKALQE